MSGLDSVVIPIAPTASRYKPVFLFGFDIVGMNGTDQAKINPNIQIFSLSAQMERGCLPGMSGCGGNCDRFSNWFSDRFSWVKTHLSKAGCLSFEQ